MKMCGKNWGLKMGREGGGRELGLYSIKGTKIEKYQINYISQML